jgi:hypothetical protein
MTEEGSPRGSADAARISDALLEDLRRLLAAHNGPGVDEGEVSHVMRAIAAEARAKGVRAEQLVVSLKAVFASIAPPVGKGFTASDARSKQLASLVTTCVREYYASVKSTPPGDAKDGS